MCACVYVCASLDLLSHCVRLPHLVDMPMSILGSPSSKVVLVIGIPNAYASVEIVYSHPTGNIYSCDHYAGIRKPKEFQLNNLIFTASLLESLQLCEKKAQFLMTMPSSNFIIKMLKINRVNDFSQLTLFDLVKRETVIRQAHTCLDQHLNALAFAIHDFVLGKYTATQ